MTPLRLTFPIPPFLQVTWLAKWKDSINGEDKCVWLAANSSWKGKSDLAKYEKARKLKDHIGKVREDYMAGMRSKKEAQQQKAVAVYLIDKLALRVGNEKNTDEEADTVGCCSLRVEHVKLDAGENQLHLNFLGKVRAAATLTAHRPPKLTPHPTLTAHRPLRTRSCTTTRRR